jgi:hypothetical protein
MLSGGNMRKRTLITLSLILVVVVLLLACGTATTTLPASGGNTNSTLDGQVLLQQRCGVCHSVSRVTSTQKTTDQWKRTVDRMIANGAQLSPQEEQILVTYLAQNFK